MAGIIESSPAHRKFSRYDIRVIIKFSVILGKDASCIHKDLVIVLGENAPSIQTNRYFVSYYNNNNDDGDDDEDDDDDDDDYDDDDDNNYNNNINNKNNNRQ
ncbi:hypothetical protein ElyMa_000986300 [Elysia marginata]|uniref:Uncharacterized protein n=1 Tax=Elysia marginata TaxID=1093978 RepID=A0AAV4HH49_9GAST|nr:hypothetical protein ElyMa_000986300 [Elysia marginata]